MGVEEPGKNKPDANISPGAGKSEGKPKREWADLIGIEVISGTAEDEPTKFRGFVTVRAEAKDGSFLSGQLDPDDLRAMALNFLQVAEAAEQDAIVMEKLVEMEIPPEIAARFVMDMREKRKDG